MSIAINKGSKSGYGIVSNQVKSYENDPYFIKKAEKARKTLERVGLPKVK